MGHAQGGRGPTTWLRPRLPSTAIIAFHLQWLEPVQTAMRSLFTAKNNTGPQTEHQFCGLLGILVFIFPAANLKAGGGGGARALMTSTHRTLYQSA